MRPKPSCLKWIDRFREYCQRKLSDKGFPVRRTIHGIYSRMDPVDPTGRISPRRPWRLLSKSPHPKTSPGRDHHDYLSPVIFILSNSDYLPFSSFSSFSIFPFFSFFSFFAALFFSMILPSAEMGTSIVFPFCRRRTS